MQDYEIVEYATTQLTLPDKIDPSDAMSWQHHLYSKLGTKREPAPEENQEKAVANINKEQQLQELVERIVAMAKVLYGLHMVRILLTTHFTKEKNYKNIYNFNYTLPSRLQKKVYLKRILTKKSQSQKNSIQFF